jgi:hypothetical protein
MRPADAAWPPTRRDTEITAGIPGLGLSGLFALLCGLSLPLARRRRVPVARLLGLSVVMTAAVVLTWEVIVEGITIAHGAGIIQSHGVTSRILGHGFWQVPVIAISASIMVLLIAAGEALLHLVGIKPTPTPPPVRSRLPSHQYRFHPPGPAPRHKLPGTRRAK